MSKFKTFWEGLRDGYRKNNAQCVLLLREPPPDIDQWLAEVKDLVGHRILIDHSEEFALVYIPYVDPQAYDDTVQAIESVGMPSPFWSWVSARGHILSKRALPWKMENYLLDSVEPEVIEPEETIEFMLRSSIAFEGMSRIYSEQMSDDRARALRDELNEKYNK